MAPEQKIIRAKAGLLELARQLGSFSQACRRMKAHLKLTPEPPRQGGRPHPTRRTSQFF